MTELNPYQSPRGPDRPTPSWIDRLFWLFKPPSDTDLFLIGFELIHYGVVFRIDPRDTTTIFASLPLAEDDAVRVRRNVLEARRTLAEFLSTHPDLVQSIMGRTLVVRMIRSYDDIDNEIHHEIVAADEWEGDQSQEPTDE